MLREHSGASSNKTVDDRHILLFFIASYNQQHATDRWLVTFLPPLRKKTELVEIKKRKHFPNCN